MCSLSFADLILTTFLLQLGGAGVYESNPIAQDLAFESFGWKETSRVQGGVLPASWRFVSLVIYWYSTAPRNSNPRAGLPGDGNRRRLQFKSARQDLQGACCRTCRGRIALA